MRYASTACSADAAGCVSTTVMPLAFMVNGFLADKFSVGFCLGFNALAVLALSCAVLAIPRVEYRAAELPAA